MFITQLPFEQRIIAYAVGFLVLGYVFWFLAKNRRPLSQFLAFAFLGVAHAAVVALDVADTLGSRESWVSVMGIVLPIFFGLFIAAANITTQRVGTEQQKKLARLLIPIMAVILLGSVLSIILSNAS